MTGWFVLACLSQQERPARDALKRRRVDAVIWPGILAGYVLVPARDAERAAELVHEHRGLRRLLSDYPVPEADVRRLERLSGRPVAALAAVPPLEPGMVVRVVAGPLHLARGVVATLGRGRKRGQALLHLADWDRPVWAPLTNLEAA